MTNWDRIKAVAEMDGYELAHGQESTGDRKSFGLLIFVKMSDRKVDRDRDSAVLYKAADEIKNALETVSAQIDPEGPAERERHRAEVADIYQQAGVEAIYMEPLPNGYCSRPCCLNKPWFRVTSRIGRVTVGRRKHVIEIDWSDSAVKGTGEALFPEEKTTRLAAGIHAWNIENAARYVRRLHESIGGTP